MPEIELQTYLNEPACDTDEKLAHAIAINMFLLDYISVKEPEVKKAYD